MMSGKDVELTLAKRHDKTLIVASANANKQLTTIGLISVNLCWTRCEVAASPQSLSIKTISALKNFEPLHQKIVML